MTTLRITLGALQGEIEDQLILSKLDELVDRLAGVLGEVESALKSFRQTAAIAV